MANMIEMGRHLLTAATQEEEPYEDRVHVYVEFLEQSYAALYALDEISELHDADERELQHVIKARPNREDVPSTRIWCLEVWAYITADNFFYAGRIVHKLRAALAGLFPEELRTPLDGLGPCRCDMCGHCVSEHAEVREHLRTEYIHEHILNRRPVPVPPLPHWAVGSVSSSTLTHTPPIEEVT